MYVSDYEQALFSLDPNLEKLRDLKEKYIRFNRSHADRPDEARSAPDALISEYKISGYTIFEEVAVPTEDGLTAEISGKQIKLVKGDMGFYLEVDPALQEEWELDPHVYQVEYVSLAPAG